MNARIQDGVFVNSSGVSPHACVSYLEFLLILQVHVPHLCMIVHLIQGVLVVCCLCANPPSYHLDVCSQVPGGEGVPKVGFPVRPKICVEAGTIFGRPSEAGCRFTSQEATRHRYQAARGRCGHTFFPPPGRFLTPNSRHLDVGWTSGNQMGWTKVCHTARSGIWVLKGNTRNSYASCQS